MRGKGKTLEEAQLLACELGEALLRDAYAELVEQNVGRRCEQKGAR
jgi:hypothetical protein